jgi:phospholipase C
MDAPCRARRLITLEFPPFLSHHWVNRRVLAMKESESTEYATGLARRKARRLAAIGPALAGMALGASVSCCAVAATAPITRFEHVIVIVQENRSPDNLFQGLCTSQSLCSTKPGPGQYNIQTANWLNAQAPGGVTQPQPAALASNFGTDHSHTGFVESCDAPQGSTQCRMDGAASESCSGNCPADPAYTYVANTDGLLDPYLTLAMQYGWANDMFQTNQGPSFPAHQFLFGATSAPSAVDDSKGIFASENNASDVADHGVTGCAAQSTNRVQLIRPGVGEVASDTIFPCFEHRTLGDIIDGVKLSWKYYAAGPNSIWTAPNAIEHICMPSNFACKGTLWTSDVDLVPSDVMNDMHACKLPDVSWVTPAGQNSDHPQLNKGGGPSWVASIVNTMGANPCRDSAGRRYWQTTAIIILWDDWGGWYDHVAPQVLKGDEGDYQLGFRVPMIFVSAYTPRGYIDNGNYDFGSVARFIEMNFTQREGMLGFADARSTTDLSTFYNFANTPRPFSPIPAPHDAQYFIDDKSPPLPPDTD